MVGSSEQQSNTWISEWVRQLSVNTVQMINLAAVRVLVDWLIIWILTEKCYLYEQTMRQAKSSRWSKYHKWVICWLIWINKSYFIYLFFYDEILNFDIINHACCQLTINWQSYLTIFINLEIVFARPPLHNHPTRNSSPP